MKNTKELLSKEMTRAEFLRFGGLAILALFGLNNFMNLLQSQQKQEQHSAHGFGSSKFGI
jgi:hypothetical protein